MSTDREALLLQLAADVRGLQRSWDKAVGVVDTGSRAMERRADAAARAIERSFGNVRLPASLRREINDLGRDIGHGLGQGSRTAQFALAGVSAFALKLAADAGEIESAFDVAFKGAAKGAREFSDVLAKKVGRDAVETREAMTRLQLVLTGAGVAADKAAVIVKRLAEVGIDAGSLFNTSDAVAFQKIISGLTGEAEPLKAFGVVINEAATKAELLRLGFKGNAEQASESAKSIARANLIIKGLAVAQGDAARTLGSAANQTRALRAQFNAAARDLGNELIPAFLQLAHGATDVLKSFNDLPGGVQLAGLAFLALVAAGGPIAGLIGGLARVIKLAKETRAAILLASGANATAGAAGAAGAAAGAGGVAGAAVAGTALIGGGLILSGRKFQQTARAPGKATDADIAGAIATARARIATATSGGPAGQPLVAGLADQLRALLTEQTRRAPKPAGAATAATPGGFTLGGDQLKPVGPPKAGKKGPADNTDQRAAQIAAQLAAADRDVLQARLALVTDARERATLEKQIVDKARDQDVARLDGTIASVEADKNNAKKAELLATLRGLKAKTLEAAALQKQSIDREAEARAQADALSLKLDELDAAGEVLDAQAAIAKTAAARRAIELRLLDLADQRLKAELDAVIASKTAGPADKDAARRRLGQLDATRPVREAAVRDGTQGPVDRFLSEIPHTLDEVNESAQRLLVDGLESLNGGLVDAVLNARSLGDVARNVFRQIVGDLISQTIRQNITGPIASFLGSKIPGFANGTSSAPGGLAWVGERGRELINLPKGSQVIPNNMLGGLGRGGVTQTFHADFRGAVVTEDLMRQFQAYADQVGVQAAVAGGAMGAARAEQRMTRRARGRLGGF